MARDLSVAGLRVEGLGGLGLAKTCEVVGYIP